MKSKEVARDCNIKYIRSYKKQPTITQASKRPANNIAIQVTYTSQLARNM